jgi:HprK-related kinase A
VAPQPSWAYRTATLRALSYRFAVCCDDEVLGHHIESLLSALSDPDGPEEDGACHRYTLTAASDPGTLDAGRDDALVHAGMTTTDAIGWLIWDVNRAAAEASGHHLLFHAGALEAEGGGVLVPGPSGSGKSTLSAGLAQAGLGYLSDELAALELATWRLLPYPKPITLKAGSFAVLRDLDPAAEPGDVGARACAGGAPEWQWQIPVGTGTARRVGEPCEPAFVVVPRYDPGGATELVPMSETEAFLTLALNAVNLIPHEAAGTEALGRLAAGCECFSLRISDLDEACRLVLDLVDGTETMELGTNGAGHGP